MKKTMRFLSMALAILLIIQLFPVTSLAAKADELRALAQADAAQAAFAPVAYEEVEKRDANTKVFKRKDGSYTAILSPQPLHYEENGAWKEIDNTLERKTVDGRQVLQNRQNAFRVSLPEAVTGKDPVSVTKAGYTLSFTMQEVSGGAPASVKQPSRAEKKAAQEAPEAVQEAKLERQSASLVYEDVQPDTDVEYTVLPQSVKENIILQKVPDGDVLYRFQIRAEGLIAVQKEDNSISFEDKAGEAIFLLPAPFLYDASHAVSTDVAVSLSGKNGTYTLTYTPSKDWLAADERVYPVILDPIVETNVASGIEDSYAVSSGLGAVIPHHLLTTALVEKDAANTYIKFLNSNIWSSKTSILGATLTMYGTNQSSDDTVITAHQVTESWMDKHLIHTTEPAAEEAVLDYATVSSSQPTALTWDITKAVAEWKANSSFNFGIKLQVSNQSASGKAELYTSEYTDAQYRPVFQIEYRETSGKPAQYDYHTQSVGRAGEVSVNDYTRGIYIARDEIGIDGNIMPVSIRRYFSDANVNSLELMVGSTFSPYGNRWLTNYNRLISYNGNDADGNERYRYLDEDGTVRYYIASGEPAENGRVKWIEECPMGVGDTGSALWLPESLTDKADYTKLELENAQGQKLTFDARGRLVKITDDTPNANHITVVYDGASLIKINKIVDGVGREYRFVYDTQQASQGLLTAIECYAADGTAITVSDETGAEIPLKMTYTYSKNLLIYRLASAVYPDGETATYEYNAFMLPSAVNNIDGYRMEYEYDGAGRVSKMTEKAKDPETGGYVTGNVVTVTSQGIYQTTFADNWGNTEVKHFDRYGRTESIRDKDGKLIRQEYEEREFDGAQLSLEGNVSDIFDGFQQTDNKLSNGDFSQKDGILPVGWDASGLAASDKLVSVSINEKTVNALALFGGMSAQKRLAQTVAVTAKAGDLFTLGGWAKSDAAVTDEDSRFSIRVAYTETFTKEDGTVGTQAKVVDVPFDPYVEGWQFNARVITFEGDCSEMRVSIEYTGQMNGAQFAGLRLSVQENGDVQPVGDYCVCGPDCAFGQGCSCQCESEETCTCEQCKRCKCEGCIIQNCSCRCESNEACDCPQCKRGSSTTRDDNHQLLQTSITDGTLTAKTSNTYTTNGNYTSEQTDLDGKTTTYQYNEKNGLIKSMVSPEENPVEYTHNVMRQLVQVKQAVSGLSNGNEIVNEYSYQKDRLMEIRHNDAAYRFDYNMWGLLTGIQIGSQSLQTYTYGEGENRNRLNKVTFGNGQTVTYSYDPYNNITGISYDNGGSWRYTFLYDEQGRLVSSTDHLANCITTYGENTYEIKSLDDGEPLYSYAYSDDNNYVETVNGVMYTYSEGEPQYDEESGERSTSITVQGAEDPIRIAKTADFFGRPIERKTEIKNSDGSSRLSVAEKLEYRNFGENQTGEKVAIYRTHAVCPEKNLDDTGAYRYEYDTRGNITAVYDISNETPRIAYRYVYDNANQLIRFDDHVYTGYSFSYAYDKGGNLVSKSEYHLDGETRGNLIDTVSYSYDNSNWKDQLTAYDGKTITYDAIGNPLSYNGWKYTWTAGRQLASAWHPNLRVKLVCQYNANGLRTQKKIYNTDDEGNIINPDQYATWDYVWRDGKLTSQTVSYTGIENAPAPKTMRFLYDIDDNPTGFVLDGKTYLYIKDLQGNVQFVVDEHYEAQVMYGYDAWGVQSSSALPGEMGELIQEMNPFTYRGYQYDRETDLYYLQSRYYNPEWGRFLNADQVLETNSKYYNLFAYCDNNPIMFGDPKGTSSEAITEMLVVMFLTFKLHLLLEDYGIIKTVDKRTGRQNYTFDSVDYNKNYTQFKLKYGDTTVSTIPQLWMDAHFEGRTKGQWNVYITKKGVNPLLRLSKRVNDIYSRDDVSMLMSAISDVSSPNVQFAIGLVDIASMVVDKLPNQYLNKEAKFIKKEMGSQAETNNDMVYILRRVEYYGYMKFGTKIIRRVDRIYRPY